MSYRIFIAINLPKEIKQALLDYQKKWPTLPVRWTREENLHITFCFLGYLDEEQLAETITITRETALKHQPLEVVLNKILYGPIEGPPRMVWVEVEKNPKLLALQKDLETTIYQSDKFKFKNREIRPFSPHITLGRINTWAFKHLEPDERPEINEEISLSFQVRSIDVMESKLKRGGAEYTILESVSLSK